MKKFFFGILFTGLSLMASNGEALSNKCVACHGAVFEKSALGKSAVVNGQSASDIYSSLIGYKQGTRNTAGMGALMKGQTASMSNNDLWAIAEYVASLSEEAQPATEEVAPAAEANAWPYACSEEDLTWLKDGRHFKISSSSSFPGIGIDTKTIKIDKKNKLITVWTSWVSSDAEKQGRINEYGNKYNEYGYDKSLMIIDYRNMRSKNISAVEYTCQGNVIANYDYKPQWERTIPDSVMEEMTNRIMQKYNLK
jgi:cytochrome c